MIRYIFLVGFLCLGLIVKSQGPVAEFTANVTNGCAPVVVDFKDVSSGDPKSWNWDFGNGQLSNKQNPQIAYYYPGKYTVTLVVRNANGTNGITKTDYIIVNPSPKAEFTADYNNVCLPANIQFTDQSVPNAGTLIKWEWDFGDGTFSSVQNPQKSYTATGFYTVSLRVTNSTGCTHFISKIRFIRVLPGVDAAFKDPVSQVCKPPYNLNFINETSGPGTLSYNWDFGNGNTSIAKDPTITVNNSTPLNVQLIVKSDLGCGDTVKKTISVSSAITTFNGPDSACLNTAVAFQNTSSLTPVKLQWTFSDGVSSSTQPLVSRSFATAGNYTVKLVNTYAECIDSLTKAIKILGPPTVDFTSNTPGSCKAPLIINFQDISPSAASWLWNFGDGSTSTQKNPSHSYTNTGEYNVSLTIITVTGCQNTLIKPKFIRITAPVVQIANAPSGGCAPFTFNAIPNVSSIDGVSSYLWDFGDGGATSTLQNPSHTYNNTGNYTLKLSIVTSGGCAASVTLVDGIKTGLPSVTDFKADTVQACSDSAIQFRNLSTPAGLSYSWNFGDTKTSTISNPVHRYDSIGVFDVSLTGANNGCLTTLTKPGYIKVLPPLAKFTFTSDCRSTPSVSFTNTSIIDNTKPVSYLWKFGDPANGTSTIANPVYTFPSKSSYNVSLTVTNGDCVNTYTHEVALANPSAFFTIAPRDTVCRYQDVTFTSNTNNALNITKYMWSFDGSPFSQAYNIMVIKFDHNGRIPATLAIEDIVGCKDTLTKFVTVIGPLARFETIDSVVCENSTVRFTDLTTPVGTVKQWTWDFGDGTKQNYTTGPFTHQYKSSGSYNVTLTITGINGCTDAFTINNLVRVSKPVISFSTKDTVICPGSTAVFLDSSRVVNPVSYLWKFGDGATSALQNPSHTYPGRDISYTVSLKITDAAGCSDSLSKINYIKATAPTSAFTVSDSATICPPLQVEFFPQGKNYTSFYWDFGDNTKSTLDTASHFYNDYGSFVAKLIVTGPGGCVDSSEHVININNPNTSTITYSPLNACNSLLVDFIIKKPINSFYIFNFGDGVVNTSQKDSLQHFFSSPNIYSPSMELGDSSGCRVYIAGPNPIKVLGAEPFFSPDKKSFCDSGTVFFTNYTLTNDPIVSSVWDFGDGSTSPDKEPVHSYTQPGQYVVSLTVNTLSGCSKSITDTIRVYKTPEPSIAGDSVICVNSQLSLKAVLTANDSTAVYNWNLGNGSNSAQINPAITYAKEGNYTINLEVTNILGCKGNALKSIRVAPLPVITIPAEIVMPVGSGVPMPVSYSPNIQSYSWLPASGLSCSNCAIPIANPKLTTTYAINVVDNNSCKSSAQIILTVVCNDKNYFVPNTFSPNGDGNNDVFYPRGNNINRVQSMRIFSRWGQMIFDKKNFAANSAADGWDGTYNGKSAPNDVYVYIVEFICENGSIIPFKGNVTLIR